MSTTRTGPRIGLSILLIPLLFILTIAQGGESRLGIDRAHYGVWDRTSYLNIDDYPFTTGQSFSEEWGNMHIARGVYDWTWLDDALQYAYEQGHKCYIKIQPVNGSISHPAWLWVDENVPTFNDGVNDYGDYLDPEFQEIFAEMVMAFGDYVRNGVPEHLQGVVAWVRVESGRSGDEVPFSNHAGVPAEYQISDEDWKAYKLWVYDLYDQAFQEGEGYVVPLLFNGVQPEKNPDMWAWCVENITGGLGSKYGGMVRGHHLSTSATVANSFKHLAEDNDVGLFSRNEMDQTWQWSLFASTNLKLNMYWTAVEQLHAGMSVWDVTSSCLTRTYIDEHESAFEFFDKWAAELVPETAGGGFCILHEGLDSSDTVKFPESEYGVADNSNLDRYAAICADYATQGAQMDDLESAKKGQLGQRQTGTGLNDVAWDLVAGNYTRFIEQIDAENTSIGVWRIGGGATANLHPYSRFGRSFENASGKNTMYFDVKDNLVDDPDQKIKLSVIYYDDGTGQFALQYDAKGNSSKTAFTVTKTNTGTWKTASAIVTDGVFGNGGPNGADLMLANLDSDDDVFHMVELLKICDVNIGASGRGTVEAKHGLNSYGLSLDEHMEGYELDLLAVPEQGWELTSWSGDASGTAENFKLFPTADTRVTANFAYTGRFYSEDDFNTTDFTGGAGWSGDWVANSDTEFLTNPVNSTIRLYSDGQITRTLAVPVSNAVLEFKRDMDKLDDNDGDFARAEVYDGAWHTVWEVEGASANGATKALWQESIDLSAYGTISQIRFTADIEGGESFTLDNIRIVGYDATATNDQSYFTADPIAGLNGSDATAYSGSIASHATDPNSDPLTFTKVSGPDWLIIANDGTLSGTPGVSDLGLNTFIIEVQDVDGTDEATLLIMVDSINNPPVFASDPLIGQDAVRGGAYSASLASEASDPDAGQILSFRKLSGPEWLSVAADGTISGTPYGDDIGLNVFTVEVIDDGAPLILDTAELNITVQASVSGTLVFNPTDDTWVSHNSTKLNANYGTNSQLRVGKDAAREAFLNFGVSGIAGHVTSATLRLYSINVNQTVHCNELADTTWDELAVTYNNRPSMSNTIDSVVVVPDAWNTFDVTSYISADGVYAFGLEGTASNKNFHSKEGTYIPELVIEYGNSAPVFNSNPLTEVDGYEGQAYSGTLAAHAVDAEGDPLTFTKVSGPSWLTVAADGTLSGTPAGADAGMNEFLVRVEDNGLPALSDVASLSINVLAYIPSGTLTLTPTDDTWVTSGSVNANQGGNNVLRVGKDAARESFLMFDVDGIAGSITSAELRLYSKDVDQTVHCNEVSDIFWLEYGVTYSNRPAMGATIDSVLTVSDTWNAFDVTSYVTAAGTFAFGLEGTAGNDDFYSKESAYVPELVITFSGGYINLNQSQAAAMGAGMQMMSSTSSSALPETMIFGEEPSTSNTSSTTENLLHLSTSSMGDLRAFADTDGVVVEYVSYDTEASGIIELVLLDADDEWIWNGIESLTSEPDSSARFSVPGLNVGSFYNFLVRDEFGDWWDASGVIVEDL